MQNIENFYESVEHIERERILSVMERISNTNLMYLPDTPLTPKTFTEENSKLRQSVGNI